LTNSRRTLRRLLIPVAATLVAGTWVAAGAATPALAHGTHEGCVTFAPGHYDAKFAFTFTVDSATHTAKAAVAVDGDKKLCGDVPITLVSYVKPADKFGKQWKYDSRTKVLGASTSNAEFSVSVPSCAGQADLFFGGDKDIRSPLDTDNLYGSLILGDDNAPGSSAHPPKGKLRAGQQWGGKECAINPGATWMDTCNGVTGTFQKDRASLETTITVYRNGTKVGAFPVAGGDANLVRTWEAKDGDTFKATYVDKATGAEKPWGEAHTYKKPGSCTPPPPAGGGGSPSPSAVAGGSLPTTGASVLLLVGAGVVLIGGGGAAMFLTRRRKSTTEEG
jgi:LPXTG-motif cell wall-anchored protein